MKSEWCLAKHFSFSFGRYSAFDYLGSIIADSRPSAPLFDTKLGQHRIG